MTTDLYSILNVNPAASQDEIRMAYLRLAKIYRPDVRRTDNATIRMQMINRAYEILGDQVKRTKYDQERRARVNRNQSRANAEPIHNHHGFDKQSNQKRYQTADTKQTEETIKDYKTDELEDLEWLENFSTAKKRREKLVFIFMVLTMIMFLRSLFTQNNGIEVIVIGILAIFVYMLNCLLNYYFFCKINED